MEKLVRITTVPISLEKLLGNQMQFMRQHYSVIAVSSDEDKLKEIGEKEGVRIFSVGLTRKITPVEDLKALYKMYVFLKKEKPYIVHSHTPKAGTIGMLAAKLAGVPNRLHTVAGLPLLEALGGKRKLLNFVEKITYSCATRVYPNSNGLKDIIVNEGFCKPNKLKVIANGSSNGIDTNQFKPIYTAEEINDLRINLGIDKNDFVFIFVGRLVGDKGINELIQAFSSLSQKYLTLKLLLVGPFESDLDPLKKNVIGEIENNKAIITTGYQKDVKPFFSIADALVFPSYREGFPNVVMQAGAMGLPSIVSDINGCNEIIVEGENGIIITPKDLQSLSDAMEKLIIDKQLYQLMKSNSRRMIVERYEQQVVWDSLLNEYKSL